jgi:hypothetical protein
LREGILSYGQRNIFLAAEKYYQIFTGAKRRFYCSADKEKPSAQ